MHKPGETDDDKFILYNLSHYYFKTFVYVFKISLNFPYVVYNSWFRLVLVSVNSRSKYLCNYMCTHKLYCNLFISVIPVSYTHLDVYKRQ